MKIGLFRHFKTDYRFPRRCNSEEYNREYFKYEESRIILPDQGHDVSIDGYAVCYASTAPRAMETARLVFKKEIIFTAELAEVPLQAVFNTKIRLPMKFWHVINRMGWAFNAKKLPETMNRSKERAVKFLAGILDSNPGSGDENILLVTHGFFMLSLQAELLKRGFKGKEMIRVRHGTLYEFKKDF